MTDSNTLAKCHAKALFRPAALFIGVRPSKCLSTLPGLKVGLGLAVDVETTMCELLSVSDDIFKLRTVLTVVQ